MKRTEQHRIDSDAQKTLKILCPSEWVINPLIEDYGKDFLVEIFEGDDPTPYLSILQLKGKIRPRYLSNGIELSIAIECDHLKYYCENIPVPVFLVVADTQSRSAYYLFLQEYRHYKIRPEKLDNGGTISLRVPLENNLQDQEAFKKAVSKSWDFMNSTWKGGLNRITKERIRHLASLDPRFECVVEIKDGNEHVTVNAKENVPMSISIMPTSNKSDVRPSLDEMIDRGLPVTFRADEIKLTGTPLFTTDGLRSDSPVTIQFGKKVDFSLQLLSKNEVGEIAATLPTYEGKLEGGIVQQRFTAKRKNFLISGQFVFEKAHGRGVINATIDWNFRPWHRRKALALPYFEELHEFLSAVKMKHRLFIRCKIEGVNAIDTEIVDNEIIKAFCDLQNQVEWVHRVRVISKYFNINPTLPEKLSETDFDDIEILYAIVSEGKFCQEYPYTLRFECEDAPNLSKELDSIPTVFKSESADIEYSFLNEKFIIPLWREKFFEAVKKSIEPINEGRLKVFVTGKGREVSIEWGQKKG